MKLYKLFKNAESWQKIIFSLVLGIFVGALLGPKADYLKPVGTLFINAIHMIIVPIIFTSIVCAILSMDDPKKMGRIGIKAILIYTFSMIISAAIGLGVSAVIAPGEGLLQVGAHTIAPQIGAAPTLVDTIVNMVPSSPAGAFVSGNILQILVFSVFLGIAINLSGEKGLPVANFFRSFSSVAIKLTQMVMRFAPIGIFALIAWVCGVYGLHTLIPLIKLVGTVYLCCILLAIFYYSVVLVLFVRMSPLRFFKGILSALLFAYSTSSSAATLPVTMRCAEDNLGISKKLSGFLLPLGTTLNLNGLSIYLGAATVFAANMYGIHLGPLQYITIAISIVLTCMGAGGIPGSGIIVMGAVMGSVNLPLGAITLLAGVDRLNDMAQTTTNVMGDLFTATVIAKHEKEIQVEEPIEDLPEASQV